MLPCLCFLFFLNQVAEIMLIMLFNTLLKITLHNTEKEEEEKKEQSRALHDDIRSGLPIQFLTPLDRA